MNTTIHPSTRHQSPRAATANTLPETASPASRHSLLAASARDKILKPAGANSMVVGGDKEADRKENEVKYYGGSAYSSVKPKRFDSHGGWIATPIDLLRFLRHESVLSKSYAHYGEMSGTTSVLRRRSDNISYAAASNASNDSTKQMNAMLEEIVEGVTSWPNHDLF